MVEANKRHSQSCITKYKFMSVWEREAFKDLKYISDRIELSGDPF